MYVVTEAAEVADQSVGALTDCLWIGALATFFITHSLVQDLPGDAAQAMCNRPDRFEVPDSRRKPPVQDFEDTALRLDGCVGRA